jgi:segregation and condensation protein B
MRLVIDETYMEEQQTHPRSKRRPVAKPVRGRFPKAADAVETDDVAETAEDVETANGVEAGADSSGENQPGESLADGNATVANVSGESTPAEDPDGAVQDEPGDESGSDGGGELPTVNLRLLEALLLATHHPLTAGRLAELLDLPTTKPVRVAVKTLNADYEQTNRSFRIEQVAGGYQILTLAEFGEALGKLHQKEIDAKLTKAALETLAIIAYKQPILRAEIEAIRGVACGETIRSLMEKHLVKIAGRAEEPGRPILYGTTKRFLELFGLNSLKDLPQNEDGLKPQV